MTTMMLHCCCLMTGHTLDGFISRGKGAAANQGDLPRRQCCWGTESHKSFKSIEITVVSAVVFSVLVTYFFCFKVSVCKRPAWLEIVAAISAKSITKAHCRSVIRSFWLAGVFLPPQICKIFLYSEFPEFPVTLKRLCHSLLGMDPEQKLPTEETQEDGLNQQVSDLNLNSNGNENENGNGVTVDQGGDVQPTAAEFSMMRKVLRNKLLHHTQNKVEILQKDPNNPLYSVKSFDELNIPEPLLRGIYDMGFSKPSRIQEAALPILLHTPPTNLIAQSQSGTGKTAAFLLASLYRVKPEVKEPQVIILAPTYELALQTGEVAQQMAKYRPEITIKYVIRGEVLPRGTKLQDHILIGTPGKMIDWSLKYQFFDIKKIRVFVLDEADVMIDTQGLRAQSVKMKQFLPESCQMMLFSATYSDEVMEFARSIIREPVLILKLRVEEQSLDNINQYYIDVSNEQEKYEALTNIFGTISMGQAFIFVETKISASRLVQQLRKDEHSVGLISGDLTVEQRNEALKRFREGQERVIVATNVMARGIDIEQVSLVINYDLPINVETREVDCETYLHRIGRTGRFGKEGLAINFVDGYRSRAMIQVLEEHFGKPIKKLDATDVDEIEKIGNDM